MRHHAVVIGAGMGGLLAARVLSERFARVTILERDSLPSCGENRRGVPQGRHTHGLLASGANVLETLFPGFAARAVAAGALKGDIARDARWFNEGGCLARSTSGLDGLLLSRPLLEGLVREEVRRLPNVAFHQQCAVEGLVSGGGRVVGVRVGGETVSADLVVDSSGRGGDSQEWLRTLGFEAPPEERVEVALAYTTRLFHRDPRQLGGDRAVIIPPTPLGKRGGVMLAQEGGRWTVTLITHFSAAAPGDLPGFRDFARTLPASYIHEVVRESDPIGDATGARMPASVRRRYEKLSRFPEGYLVFGDAICSFNPIYGQGMSVAALQAIELRRALEQGIGDLALRFYKLAAPVIDIPWSIAVGNDLRMPEAVGPRTAPVRLINWYMSKLHRAAHHDPALTTAFLRVANLIAPPPSVMHPANVLRVVRGNLRRSHPSASLADAAQVLQGGNSSRTAAG
jgi:2-polyprenyl-6-methoxyphenol hydroxylase-like FAD-dependent oxidoreductase